MLTGDSPRPYVVEPGRWPGCQHHDTQLVWYQSPTGDHRLWSCPTCHRIVRQDNPALKPGGWHGPVAVVPKGLEGVLLPSGHRGWKMPDVEPRRRRWCAKIGA